MDYAGGKGLVELVELVNDRLTKSQTSNIVDLSYLKKLNERHGYLKLINLWLKKYIVLLLIILLIGVFISMQSLNSTTASASILACAK